MTNTVVAGPRPSGLNTCSDTRYCVYVSRSWISWLCRQYMVIIIYIIEILFTPSEGLCASHLYTAVPDVDLLRCIGVAVAHLVRNAVAQELAEDRVGRRRLPRDVNGRGGGVVRDRGHRFADGRCWTIFGIYRHLVMTLVHWFKKKRISIQYMKNINIFNTNYILLFNPLSLFR